MPIRRRTSTASTPGAVEVGAVVEDLPVDASARDEVVHPVQAADVGALAAAGRADDRGHEIAVDLHPDPGDGGVAPVVDGKVLHVEDRLALHGECIIAVLAERQRGHVDDGPACGLCRVFVHVLLLGIQRASFLRLRASAARAIRLAIRTKAIRTSDAAHAFW